MKRVKRTITLVQQVLSQDSEVGTLVVRLSCEHEFQLQTDRLWLSDLYDHYHQRQRLGMRLRCKQCEEAQAHE